MGMRLAIVGATGIVGEQLLSIIGAQSEVAIEPGMFASESSRGMRLKALGREFEVQALADCDFSQWDAAFFCVGDELSAKFVPQALAQGCAVVDKSNAYRLDPAVPLVVAGVNDAAVASSNQLVANPNCSTIVLTHALYPLLTHFGISRVFAATYQSVSGAGKAGVQALDEQNSKLHVAADLSGLGEMRSQDFAGNVIPGIGSLDAEGRCGEEAKLVYETRKILSLPELPVIAHAARVPVFVGHSIAVSVELDSAATEAQLVEAFRSSPDLQWMEDALPTPVGAARHDRVEVGRLRAEPGLPNGWSFFLSGDNLRLGAALNGWRILRIMLAAGALRGTTVSQQR